MVQSEVDKVNKKQKSTSIYMNAEHVRFLKKLADQREKAGRKPSISQLVAEAVDKYLRDLGIIE